MDVYQSRQSLVYIGLEGGGGVRKAKWHNCPFKKAIVRLKRRLPLVSLCNPNLIVGFPDIELRKPISLC